jgi:methyl-accepting chemotaxis protein
MFVMSDEWQPVDSNWNTTERDWYKGAVANPDRIYMTDLYQDAATGKFCVTFSRAFKRDDAVAGVLAVDIFTDELTEVVMRMDIGEDSYAFLSDVNNNILIHNNEIYLPALGANGEMVYQNIESLENGHYAILVEDETIDSIATRLRGIDGTDRYYSANRIPISGWILYTAIPVNVVNAPLIQQIIWTVVTLVAVLVVAVILISIAIRRMIVSPVKDVTEAANLLALGEKVPPLKGDYMGEMALLVASFMGMEEFNRQQAMWMESIANGDLAVEVTPRSENDTIGQAMVSMLCNLNTLFSDINESSHQVFAGSKQIADGAQSLAQGTTEQASAIEELSATIGEIIETTERNAKIAGEAAKLSDIMRSDAEKGSFQMDQLMEAVKEINDASKSIRNVIKTIEDIAFQTNILALNAAVEAARAGQHGKGFAVVADEVRNLASKSAEAAKNTEELIGNSIEKANMGLEIATETASSLAEIVEGIIKSTELARLVAASSDNQTEVIAQVNRGIEQVSMVVQQNSATAEESAAASEEMSSQSSSLETLISYFKLMNFD